MKTHYGRKEITFHHRIDPALTHAYITVDFNEGVILKSPPLDPGRAEAIVRKKAPWILGKLKLVAHQPQGDIVTGTRILYLGRNYYTRIIRDPGAAAGVVKAGVEFNHSSFNVYLDPFVSQPQEAVIRAFDDFYRRKAVEKIEPRVRHWSRITGLDPEGLRFRRLSKRWGSCTKSGEIIINIYAVKLPYYLIDYIIVHELCHLLHKGHGNAFWREVEKYLPSYPELEKQISIMQC
jgi:predicted metal-dependent hydrolase